MHHIDPLSLGSRREFLRRVGMGLGGVAMASLLQQELRGADIRVDPLHPLAARKAPLPCKAKRVIHIFANGGASQVDTFDRKIALDKYHGKTLPGDYIATERRTGSAFRSPFSWKRYGKSGLEVSELFAKTAEHADDLCVIRSMKADVPNHEPSLLLMNCGEARQVRPSMGSWVTYGLGTENQDLPGYITICPTLTHGGVNAYSSAFMPAVYHGTPLGNAGISSDQAKIPFIENADKLPRSLQSRELSLLQQMNQEHLAGSGPDAALEGRINSFELAFRMQTAAPELQNLSTESEATQKMYGLDKPQTANFGRQCLMARRFAERGVRFIQCTHSYKWDQHGGLKADHGRNAMEVDQPIAALLTDLKSRGLLDDTLILWGGEFGRTPVAQGDDGRDHNPQGYTMWLAGGGVKPGIRYGETDDYGYYAVKDKVHLHDLHATMLHLLGLDHLKLTYKFAGRDFRLTDVHGEVVHDLIA